MDGLKSGSPEAISADRDRDAERKRRERAEKRAAETPPTLPVGAPPALDALENPTEALAGHDAVTVVDPVGACTADDFRGAAVELVELAEAWRIDTRTRQAAVGKLPRPVVEEIGKAAAFPPGSKKSLSNSSPATLAKMFNSLQVPVALKSVVSAVPALAYIIVRDIQTGARIEKLITEDKTARQTPAGENK